MTLKQKTEGNMNSEKVDLMNIQSVYMGDTTFTSSAYMSTYYQLRLSLYEPN